MATDHEQAVLAAALEFWRSTFNVTALREHEARAKLCDAVADWQQAEQARKESK